jgi:4,5-dihydroxyphthalate decarboxylase
MHSLPPARPTEPMPRVRFACGLYDRMLGLYTGEVKPEGFELEFIRMDSPREIFDRMAAGLEFDAAEMSCSEFITRIDAGRCPLVAIPVFPSRAFRHNMITVRADAGIATPKDLEGRRVGVPLYTMTAAVWIRGHLQHEYGVDIESIHWVQGAINKRGSHGNPKVMPLLRQVPIEINRGDRTLGELLQAGELDAIIGTALPDGIHTDPNIRRLFPDFRKVEQDYYRRTGIFPTMHLLAMRRDLHEQHPFIAASLYRACCQAKDLALAKMKYLGALRYMLPWLTADLVEIDALFDGDPWPYGVEANRPTLEAFVQYLQEQGMVSRAMPIESLFVPVDGSARHMIAKEQ